MVIKRAYSEGEGEGFTVDNQEAKRRITSSNFVQNLMCENSSKELASVLEPLIRRCVREEIERACQSYFCTLPRSPLNTTEPRTNTSLQLRIYANLPKTFFTNSKIESEDNSSVKLVLFDVNSNKIVSCGPFSSLKVEIVALDGDFSTDDEDDWSEKDFESKIINARDGRRPLIAGDLVVTLENGVADLGEICFTDNSSWRRSRRFMIGARAKHASSEFRIREAKSHAFIVKDHRGESYKKHYPPSPVDEIWRLEKIAKDGVFHKRLASHNIFTVKDFLQMYITNHSFLRQLLGGSSNKTWETIIKHVTTCAFDDQYYPPVDNKTCQMPMVEASNASVFGLPYDNYNEMEVGDLDLLKEFSNGSYGEDLVDDFGLPSWQGNELFIDTSNQIVDMISSNYEICYSKNGSPRGRWCKIRAAVKWGSVRRDVAAKKVAKLHPFLDFLV